MAIIVSTQILGQQANATPSYCYLYEPLKIFIQESDLSAKKIYIDLQLIDTQNSAVVVNYLNKYADFDINPGSGISVDLMEIARQNHNSDIYKFASIDDIVNSGWSSIVSKYKYRFLIYSDITIATTAVEKLPIIGGRSFKDFTPAVDENASLTEIDNSTLSLNGRWLGYSFIDASLVPATNVNSTPTLSKITSLTGKEVCGGYVIWKSRLGGWMAWGFGLKNERISSSYKDKLDVGMFESTSNIGGNPYVEVNYTGISSSYGLDLRELNLSQEELNVVAGIQASPIIYNTNDIGGSLELMRLASASVPQNSIANGGNISISLDSISSTMHKTR